LKFSGEFEKSKEQAKFIRRLLGWSNKSTSILPNISPKNSNKKQISHLKSQSNINVLPLQNTLFGSKYTDPAQNKNGLNSSGLNIRKLNIKFSQSSTGSPKVLNKKSLNRTGFYKTFTIQLK